MSEVVALRDSLHDRDARIAHCRERIGKPPLLKRDRPVFSRGVMIASKVFGVDFQESTRLLGKYTPKITYEDAFERMSAECPQHAVGYVYSVESPDFPGVKKIGFSTDPERRLRELIREYRVELRITSQKVGSYADEYAAQRLHGHLWLTNEWFASPQAPRFCPQFLTTARGLPAKELTEKYLFQLGHPNPVAPVVGPFRKASEAEPLPRRGVW